MRERKSAAAQFVKTTARMTHPYQFINGLQKARLIANKTNEILRHLIRQPAANIATCLTHQLRYTGRFVPPLEPSD